MVQNVNSLSFDHYPNRFLAHRHVGATIAPQVPVDSLSPYDDRNVNTWVMMKPKMSNEKNPGWLFYIRDYTTQLYRDYNKPL